MEIIRVHYNISKPVTAYKEIEKESNELLRFIVKGKFKGFYDKAFAIAHCQVSETPYNFFVVSPDVVKEKMFKYQIIINPTIIEANVTKSINGIEMSNLLEYKEPCLSFPFRKEKAVVRYDIIKVKYQTPAILGLKTIEAQLEGIASEIFQHEVDHCAGINIFFESETPVK